MNILLLGSGGRENALAWKMKQSNKLNKLFIAPGNAGTAMLGTNVPMAASDFPQVKEFVLANNINMVVVGPEDPLVKGVFDFFKNDDQLKHIPVIGPSKEGAQLEGSKDFAKAFMMRHNIPTARYQSFTKETLNEGYAFLESLEAPYVLKADGLAAGKGVLIIESLEEAKQELAAMLNGMFGQASHTVVIEEFLSGIECSVFVLSDGNSYKILPVAKDYKRIGEGDTGLNTGGMGAVSPVPFADETFMQKVEERIV
ncbi:MAG: phosphoribosylamine--glycine ligase, partial [Bacteroidales bacterium]